MRAPSRRQLLAMFAAGSLLLACSRKTEEVVPAASALSDTATRGGTLRINMRADNTILVSLDPFQVYWIEHRVLLRNVVESLTDQDPKSGEIIPWLARSWQISEDGLQYTFVLRNDVTFSNGSRFDARAVKTSFDANKEFASAAPGAFGATYLAGYDHAEVLDDYTVKIVLSRPNASFLQATSTTTLAILAPESYARTPEERSRGALIGTGPFVLESYTPEVSSRLVRRAGYAWASPAASNAGEAYLDAIEIHYVPEESVRNGQFIQGQAHIVWPREPFKNIDIKLFEKNKGQIVSRSLPGPASNYYPNVSNGKPLADARVRQAVQKAIDRQAFARTVYSPSYPVVTGLYDTTTPYFKSQQDKLGFDPEGAERLLDDANWKKGADGIRTKDGQRLTLLHPLQYETTGDVLVQDQLRRVGIEVKLTVLVAGEYSASIAAGKYDLVRSYMTRGDPAVLQSFLDPRYANRSSLALNTFPKDVLPRAEKLFDEGLLTNSSTARSSAYGALQDLLLDESLAFPISERLWQAAVSQRVHGFQWTAEAFAQLNGIWLTKS